MKSTQLYLTSGDTILTDISSKMDAYSSKINASRNSHYKQDILEITMTFKTNKKDLDKVMNDILSGLMKQKLGVSLEDFKHRYPEFLIL